MTDSAYTVAIVVDPDFGDRVADLVDRMPVWIADTQANQPAAARVWKAHKRARKRLDYTEGLTTFKIDTTGTPESWCLNILGTVAAHHDSYSHDPGYSALELYGAAPSPELIEALAGLRLTEITVFPGGFRARTANGELADSPNYDPPAP